MSTTVTIGVARPNHRPVRVHQEVRKGAQWVPDEAADSVLAVGEMGTAMVYGSRRLIIEELPE